MITEKDEFFMSLYQAAAEHGFLRPTRATADRLYRAVGGDVGDAIEAMKAQRAAAALSPRRVPARKKAASKKKAPARRRKTMSRWK